MRTSEIAEIFDAEPLDEDPGARYNVAPTQPVAAVMEEDERRVVRLIRWGLVNSWAERQQGGAPLINARVETVATSPAFRAAFRQRRCIVPADGFYEWRRSDRGSEPFLIRSQGRGPLALAGIWSPWRDDEGDWQRSCAVVTTPANPEVATLHDRMPAILPPDAWDLWLDPTVRDADALQSLLVPWDGDALLLQPVSRLVNRVVNEGPALLRPDPPEPVQTTLFDA